MTEDEAKTKACWRAATFGGSQQLADGPGPHCIASACAAWRWHQPERELRRAYLGIGEDPTRQPDGTRLWRGDSWSYEHTDVDARGRFELLHRAPADLGASHGYCGPAGSPT